MERTGRWENIQAVRVCKLGDMAWDGSLPNSWGVWEKGQDQEEETMESSPPPVLPRVPNV